LHVRLILLKGLLLLPRVRFQQSGNFQPSSNSYFWIIFYFRITQMFQSKIQLYEIIKIIFLYTNYYFFFSFEINVCVNNISQLHYEKLLSHTVKWLDHVGFETCTQYSCNYSTKLRLSIYFLRSLELGQ
jgi:hypothetical protein